jgi:alpha-tubulin suppressor-like RCC1 family protein
MRARWTSAELLSAGAGTVKCWGQNSTGVLGNGSLNFQRATTPQSVAGLTKVTAISTSNEDTCAVLKGGTVKCWGFSQYGELGPGTSGPDDCPFGDVSFGCSATPVTVNGITNVVAVSVRDHSSCAVVKNTNVICWGQDISPKSFVTVSGLSGVRAIASPADASYYGDGNFSCALLSDPNRRVKCWGFNNQGQLGNGTTKSSNVPAFVPE